MTRVFIGPASAGVTGQSVAFASAITIAGPDDVVIHPAAWGDRSLRKVTRFAGAWFCLLMTLVTRRVEIVYITTSRSNVGFVRDACLILLARLVNRARVVNHLHGSDFAAFRAAAPRTLRWLVDVTYRQIGCSIILHQSMADQYVDYPHMQVVVVPNFVSAELMALRPQAPTRLRSKGVRFLFLGNLIREKGIIEAVAAVDMLVHEGRAVTLAIVGKEGDKTLIELARSRFGPSYAFGQHIEIVGPIYGNARAQAFLAADIFVLPSYYESEAFPLSALEAMAFGCALILSDFRYLPAVFGSFGVRFAKAGSVASLRNVMAELVEDRELRQNLGQRNWEAARTCFSEEQYVASIADVLNFSSPPSTLDARGASE